MLVVLGMLFVPHIFAIDRGDISLPNNKFGIHLAVPSREDEQSAAKLVNSHGGSWGYVTLVIQDNDRNTEKWQETFDNLRKLRLIPIVRLATHPDGASWGAGTKDEVGSWVAFLQSLNWVVKDRYVILFNEPNHASEWGNKVDPEGYAGVAYEYAKALHKASTDYVLMLAGLDSAAPNSPPNYLDERVFLERVVAAEPKLTEEIGALSSHSYPNPGFSAPPQQTGRTSIRGYEWELDVLKGLGFAEDLPVFITETGWARDRLSAATVADYFAQAYSYWLSDSRVKAVTPFVLNYQGAPFLQFSWQLPGANTFYPQYQVVENMEKVAGRPRQDQKGFLTANLPGQVFVSSTYVFHVQLENRGQAVWDRADGYSMRLVHNDEGGRYFFDDLDGLAPTSKQDIELYLRTGYKEGSATWKIELVRDDKTLISHDWNVRLLPLPTLDVNVGLFPRIRSKKDREFEVQLFDENEQLVYKQGRLKRVQGIVHLDRIKNVYVGGRYRVVVLSRQYLPRQSYIRVQEAANSTVMKPMLPLDFNEDGHFSLADIWALITHPQYIGYFLP